MDRFIAGRQVDTHHTRSPSSRELMAEGAGYALIVDGVLAAESEPLDRLPADAEISDIQGAHGFG